jgi:tetratricopeptide (TPR) repeat protein
MFKGKSFIAFAIVLLLAVSLRAQSGEALLQQGIAAFNQQKWKDAEAALRSYLQTNPAEATGATVMHARSLVFLGQPFDAVIEIESFLKRQPNSLPALKLYGELLDLVVKDRDQAEAVWLKCLSLDRKDADLWRTLGGLYLTRGKNDEAAKHFNEAARLQPTDALIAANLAYTYSLLQKKAETTSTFTRALRLNIKQRDPIVYFLYGRYWLEQQKYAESITWLTKCLTINPHLAAAYYQRALAYEKSKAFKPAEADAWAALREDERNKEAHQLLVRIYRAQNKPELAQKSAEAIEKIVAAEGQQQSANRDINQYLRVAEPLLREGKFAEAIPQYEQIVKTMPNFYEAYFALGISYSQVGKMAEAETALKKYLQFQPLSADGASALGILLTQLGRHQEAREMLRRAIGYDDTLPEARKALAQSHLATYEFAEAKKELMKLAQTENGCDNECELMLARAYIELDEKQAAADLINKIRQAHGKDPRFMKDIARVLLETRHNQPQTADVVTYVAEALPQDAEAQLLLADWAFSNSRPDLSQEALIRAFQNRPDEIVRMKGGFLLGQIEERADRLERAAQAYRIAWDINEKLPIPDARRATLYISFLARHNREDEALQRIEHLFAKKQMIGAAHYEQAKILFQRGQREQAIIAANLALQDITNDIDTLSGIHSFLIKAYYAVGKKEEALKHKEWFDKRQRQ